MIVNNSLFKYALNPHAELVHIDQAIQGQIDLKCPYCRQILIVRKGAQIAPHYAHKGQTCGQSRDSIQAIALPCYDQFDMGLTTKTRAVLDKYRANMACSAAEMTLLRDNGLIDRNLLRFWNPWRMSDKGNICYGSLATSRFLVFQKDQYTRKHAQLGQKSRQSEDDATNLRLYRAQLRRLLDSSLYFLKINTKNLYKIGITRRNITTRVKEIRRDLAPFYGDVQITVLGTWEKRGTVELYLKHRHSDFNHPLGTLTEYFKFDDEDDIYNDIDKIDSISETALDEDILADATLTISDAL